MDWEYSSILPLSWHLWRNDVNSFSVDLQGKYVIMNIMDERYKVPSLPHNKTVRRIYDSEVLRKCWVESARCETYYDKTYLNIRHSSHLAIFNIWFIFLSLLQFNNLYQHFYSHSEIHSQFFSVSVFFSFAGRAINSHPNVWSSFVHLFMCIVCGCVNNLMESEATNSLFDNRYIR